MSTADSQRPAHKVTRERGSQVLFGRDFQLYLDRPGLRLVVKSNDCHSTQLDCDRLQALGLRHSAGPYLRSHHQSAVPHYLVVGLQSKAYQIFKMPHSGVRFLFSSLLTRPALFSFR